MPDAYHQRSKSGIAQPRRSLSVRVRLMILAVIAIVPLLLERIHNEEFDRNERIEAAYKQARDLARQGAAKQNEVIESARALLQVVANARTTFNPSNNDCNRFLETIVKPAPWIKTLSVANVQGRIICSSFPDAIGLDISDRPHFYMAVDSGDFVLSDYFMGTRMKTPLITLALAQRGINGGASAVVLGLLDLNWFEHVAKDFVPPKGSMLMIDGKGTVLARYPANQDHIGQNFKDHPLVRDMLSRPEGFVTGIGLDGVRRIFGYLQLPGTQTRIAVGLDEKEVLARASRAMWAALGELGAVAALVLLGIWFGGERMLMRPIRALASAASRIGRGDVKIHAAELPWAAEFIPLAVALDDMATKLNEREQELRDSNNQLRELAQVDALTGLANRRTFNERLADEWKLACKLRQPIAVLMIDVDFFKKFNDLYGHVQGDACLRKVSDILMEGTRAREESSVPTHEAELPPSFQRVSGRARRPDFAARYGGEEFAVLLPGADLDGAILVAERLRRGVENLLMAHAGAPWGFVSISIGAAFVLPSEQDSPQDLTESADAALYAAKRNGRNRVARAAPIMLSQVS
ncbi:MAG: diguanylate cyclase [Rhizobiales bacterium]|nr:diguanylate cyclase [Hyphomicrobiales bacterium]